MEYFGRAPILCTLRLRRSSATVLQLCAQHSANLRDCCAQTDDLAVEDQIWADFSLLVDAALSAIPVLTQQAAAVLQLDITAQEAVRYTNNYRRYLRELNKRALKMVSR